MPRELLLTGPRALVTASYEERPLRPNEVRAGAIASALSHGTELSLYRGTSPFGSRRFDPDLRLFVDAPASEAYPMRLGYEWVGRVTEVGGAVHDFAVGDLVQLPLPHRETHVFAVDERVRLGILGRLPAGLEPDRAVLLESAGIALQAVHDARIEIGEHVAIFGLGALGLLAVQLARLSGAAWVAASDPIAPRRVLAEGFGADVTFDPAVSDVGWEIKRADAQRGVDVAIEFSGNYAALHDALRSVRMAGTVVAAGFYQGGGAALRLGEEWHHNRLTLLSSMRGWGNPHRDHPAWDRGRLRATAAAMLSDGRLRTDGLVTHRFDFEEATAAYALADERSAEVLKVVLAYQGGAGGR